MAKQTVTINGVTYDAETGLAMNGSATKAQESITFAPKPKVHPAGAVHHSTQKSQTLRRQVVKHVTVTSDIRKVALPTKTTITRSPSISKFAPHPSGAKPIAPAQRTNDIAPKAHPIAAKAAASSHHAAVHHVPASAPKPSQVIKQEAIAEALAKAPTHKTHDKAVHRKKPRALTIASASLALLLLGGYFTYLNMPSLSVRMAAAQSGVNATYPGYHPDGYSLHGAVSYNAGGVNMTFAANGAPQSYTIAQTKSNLDSTAVLENYIKPKVGNNYVPYSQQGLTIYVYGDNAAWVNGGILYTINGDAPLSSEQVLHIASSM